MATDQAMELALGPRFRGQFNATVAGAAFGTDDVGFSHGRKDSIAISVVLRRPLAFPVWNTSSRSLLRIKLGHRRIETGQKREFSVYLTRRSVRINPRRRPVPGGADEAPRLADIGRPRFEFKILAPWPFGCPASKAVTYGRNHCFRGVAFRFR